MIRRMDTTAQITITESAGIFRANVIRPCGHTFRSPSGWNSATAAKRHGRNLAACACGTCRDLWSNDPNRTTLQFVAFVPPGGQR
jgi:hypothetical protein